jgi:hypothetical protein
LAIHSCGLAANRIETTMSPICLINIAEIRDHARPSPELHNIVWYARFINSIERLLRMNRC